MNRFIGSFAWLLILLSLGLNLVAFLSFSGADWRHYVIVGSGAVSMAAFLIAYYVHRSKKNRFRTWYGNDDNENPAGREE